jgi:receptor protein-tyrosine kinase
MEYENLRRDLDRNQKLYEELLQKATEVSLSTAMRGSSQIRIVDRAVTPAEPYRPVMWKNLGLGILTSMFLGVGFVVVMARTSHRLRVPGESPQHLGVPELSVVPRCRNFALLPSANAVQKKDRAMGGRLRSLVYRRSSHNYAELAGQPPIVAEAFQNATTSIFAALNGKCGACKIMVTSAFQEEGKSTVLLHLGVAIAELGHRVILVDGDLRKPRLHTLFDLPNTWGFSTLITESSDLKTLPLEALAQKTTIDGLYLLAAGPGPGSLSRVLHSARTAELFERLSKEFEFVLIDSSPALQFSDARLIGRFVDGTILVIRAGSTSRDAAISVKDRLTSENIRVLGTILTDWNVPLSRMYEQYGS